VASFLFLPEIVSSSDLVALVPRRLLRSPREQLTVIDLPWLAGQFRVSLLWHERTHTHAGHRWIRERIAELATGRQEAPAPSGHIAPRQRRGRSADRGE
jgi:DNA-binding transcriptional LysR family regulator